MTDRFPGIVFVVILLVGCSLVACGPSERTVSEWRLGSAEWELGGQTFGNETAPPSGLDGPSVSEGPADVPEDDGANRAEEEASQRPDEGPSQDRGAVIDATDEW